MFSLNTLPCARVMCYRKFAFASARNVSFANHPGSNLTAVEISL